MKTATRRPIVVAYFMRNMPAKLRDRLRAQAAMRDTTLEQIVVAALELGVAQLERPQRRTTP